MNRRDVLKGLSGSVAGGIAMSGSAAARLSDTKSPHAHLRDEYERVDAVTKSFRKHAADLLEQLSNENLVSARDVSQFDAIERTGDSVKGTEGVHVMSTVDEKTETPTAVLRITDEFDEGTTNVFVLPEVGRSYATVEYDTGKEVLKGVTFETESETSDVTTDATCEFQKTTSECDMSDQCSSKNACTYCGLEYYTLNTYNHYECTEVNLIPGGKEVETWQKKELVDSTCSTDCCESSGCAGCPTGC